MAYRYKIFDDIKLVYVKADGPLYLKDLMDHIEKLAADPKYIPPMLKLVDYRELEGYGISIRESEIFSQKKQSLSDKFINEKCAFVVSSDLIFGMVRHHQAYLDEDKLSTNIFRDINEAKNWLGIDTDYELSV
jgi:hypothetical protein